MKYVFLFSLSCELDYGIDPSYYTGFFSLFGVMMNLRVISVMLSELTG